MNINYGDLQNTLEKLERLCKRIGLTTAAYPLLVQGDAAHCMAFVKQILFYLAKEIAAEMIARRCTEQSPDKRIVLAMFDILREKHKSSPAISAEQFLGKGLTEHKMLVIIKLVEYATPYVKAAQKGGGAGTAASPLSSPGASSASGGFGSPSPKARSRYSPSSSTPRSPHAAASAANLPLRRTHSNRSADGGGSGSNSGTPGKGFGLLGPSPLAARSASASSDKHRAEEEDRDKDDVGHPSVFTFSGDDTNVSMDHLQAQQHIPSRGTSSTSPRLEALYGAGTNSSPISAFNAVAPPTSAVAQTMDDAAKVGPLSSGGGGNGNPLDSDARTERAIRRLVDELFEQKVGALRSQMLNMAQEFDSSLERLNYQVDSKLTLLEGRVMLLERSTAANASASATAIAKAHPSGTSTIVGATGSVSTISSTAPTPPMLAELAKSGFGI